MTMVREREINATLFAIDQRIYDLRTAIEADPPSTYRKRYQSELTDLRIVRAGLLRELGDLYVAGKASLASLRGTPTGEPWAGFSD